MGRRRRKLLRPLRHAILYVVLRCVILFAQITPRSIVHGVARALGGLFFLAARRHRRRAMKNLRLAFGKEKSESELRRIAMASFVNLARNAVDAVRAPVLSTAALEELVHVKGIERFHAALGTGRGVVGITGHIGSFELMAAYFGKKGYPINAVATELYDRRLNALVIEYRARTGVSAVPRDGSIYDAINCLRRGEILGILADQDTRVGGVFVDFFGVPAYTPVGPVVLATRTKAVVLPMVIHLDRYDKHVVEVAPPVELVETGSRHADLVENTRRYTKVLEDFVRKYPEQWVWLHKRWKTRPERFA